MKGDVYGIAAEETVEAFASCRPDETGSNALLECFTSSFARDRPPRGVEQRLAVIHMGLSLFERPEQAAAVARRFPAIGGLIARVTMVSGHGFCWADTGPPVRLTAWGRPVRFVAGSSRSAMPTRMSERLSPTELARRLGMERREVIAHDAATASPT